MGESSRPVQAPPAPVLIPLDADAAMRALARLGGAARERDAEAPAEQRPPRAA